MLVEHLTRKQVKEMIKEESNRLNKEICKKMDIIWERINIINDEILTITSGSIK